MNRDASIKRAAIAMIAASVAIDVTIVWLLGWWGAAIVIVGNASLWTRRK